MVLGGAYPQGSKENYHCFSLISFRKELTDFLRKLKDAHGKSLSGLTFDEIVYKISQFIDPKRSQVKRNKTYLSALMSNSLMS